MRGGGCRPSSRFWEPAEDASGTRSWVSGMKGAGLTLVILGKSVPFWGSHFPHLQCRVASGVHFPNWAQENTGNMSRCGFPMAMSGQGYFLFWSLPSALAHWSFEKSCSEGTVLVCLKWHVPNSHKHRKPFFTGWSLVLLNGHSNNSVTDSTAGREGLGYLPGPPCHEGAESVSGCSALHTFSAYWLKRRNWV